MAGRRIKSESEIEEVYAPAEVEYKGRRTKPEKKRPGKKTFIGGGLVVIIALLGLSFYTLNPLAPLTITKLAAADNAKYGDTGTELCAKFVKAGVKCSVKLAFDEKKPVGEVISQTPIAGSRSKDVVITYSKGAENVLVPILVGVDKKDLGQVLWSAGLKLGKTTSEDSPSKKDSVVKVSKEPNSKVPNGTVIDVSLSSGTVLVPNWAGKTKEFVEFDSNEKGLTVKFSEQENKKVPAGLVIKQNFAGKSIEAKQVINVVISKQIDPVRITIPNVIGLSKAEAESTLAAAGFIKIKMTLIESPTATKAQVKSIKPGVGEKVASDRELVVIIETPKV